MFKQAKQKIVLSILSILGAVLLSTLLMVYLSSYLSITTRNIQVLTEHAQRMMEITAIAPNNGMIGKQTDAVEERQTSGEYPGKNDAGESSQNMANERKQRQNMNPFAMEQNGVKMQRHLEVGTFYTVKLTEDGTAWVIENGAPELYEDAELIAVAQKVAGKSKGKSGELLYLVTQQGEDTIVCFMDNLVFRENFTRVLLFTLLFGLLAMVVIAFISLHIAKRIVAPMEDTYRKQKQFTADAGHELKSPVAAMATNIELLEREIGSNKWLENISYENRRMQELVTELLELAQNENKTAERKPTDLTHLINSVILPLEATAFEKNILIDTDIAEGVTANVEEMRIRQLVTILVDNAISHTDSDAQQTQHISVVLTQGKGNAVMQVTNPGVEIPLEEREKLFERFYRSDSSHAFSGHYGLGLAIAKAIVDANKGSISVNCRDGLIIFTVELPAR